MIGSGLKGGGAHFRCNDAPKVRDSVVEVELHLHASARSQAKLERGRGLGLVNRRSRPGCNRQEGGIGAGTGCRSLANLRGNRSARERLACAREDGGGAGDAGGRAGLLLGELIHLLLEFLELLRRISLRPEVADHNGDAYRLARHLVPLPQLLRCLARLEVRKEDRVLGRVVGAQGRQLGQLRHLPKAPLAARARRLLEVVQAHHAGASRCLLWWRRLFRGGRVLVVLLGSFLHCKAVGKEEDVHLAYLLGHGAALCLTTRWRRCGLAGPAAARAASRPLAAAAGCAAAGAFALSAQSIAAAPLLLVILRVPVVLCLAQYRLH
mmetsp:Transcript_133652/g.298115  ORF Transcript_133652/g.298115 Transcript_133652/m.298115 type:complete len:324 (+) Transcript_133652:149-1120(+)